MLCQIHLSPVILIFLNLSLLHFSHSPMVCKYYFLWESKTRQKFPSLLLCPDLLCSSSDISSIFIFKKAFSFIWFFILILQLSQVEYTFVKWTDLAKIGKNL